MQTNPAPALSEAQRLALTIAEGERWGVWAEARDGTRVQLRRGHPARALVLFLAPPADDDDTPPPPARHPRRRAA